MRNCSFICCSCQLIGCRMIYFCCFYFWILNFVVLDSLDFQLRILHFLDSCWLVSWIFLVSLLIFLSLWYVIGFFAYDSNVYWLFIVNELKNVWCFSFSFLATNIHDYLRGDPHCQYHVQNHTHEGIFLTIQNTYWLDHYLAIVMRNLLELRSSIFFCFYPFPRGISSFIRVDRACGLTVGSLTTVGLSIFFTPRRMSILRGVLKRMAAFGLARFLFGRLEMSSEWVRNVYDEINQISYFRLLN